MIYIECPIQASLHAHCAEALGLENNMGGLPSSWVIVALDASTTWPMEVSITGLCCVLLSTHSCEHHRYGASYYCVAWLSWIQCLPMRECIANQLEGHHPPFHHGVWPSLQEGQEGRHGHFAYKRILRVYS